MFNPEYHKPLEMFGLAHILAILTCIAVILFFFFLRNFFAKNKIADAIFRYTLGASLITFEIILQIFSDDPFTLFGTVFGNTFPLCGYLLWFTAIALITNSARLMKLIYPLTILGGSLSLIVADLDYVFPHFRNIQYFFVHSGFMLGSLYFVFTKKINKYTIKDAGFTCLVLFLISCYVFLISSGKLIYNLEFEDPLYLIAPPSVLASTKEALGQFLYTCLFIGIAVSVVFTVYGITYACTRKREDVPPLEPVKENKLANCISKLTPTVRYVILVIFFGLGLYFSVFYKIYQTTTYAVFDNIFFFLFIGGMILNEITNLHLIKLKQEKHIKIENVFESTDKK